MRNIKKDFGLQEITTHMGLFDYNVICVVGEFSKLEKYLMWKLDDKESPIGDYEKQNTPRGICFRKPAYCPVIWIPRKPKTAVEHGTLSHEVIHALVHMFNWAGIKLDECEELLCHSLAHVVRNILKEIK